MLWGLNTSTCRKGWGWGVGVQRTWGAAWDALRLRLSPPHPDCSRAAESLMLGLFPRETLNLLISHASTAYSFVASECWNRQRKWFLVICLFIWNEIEVGGEREKLVPMDWFTYRNAAESGSGLRLEPTWVSGTWLPGANPVSQDMNEQEAGTGNQRQELNLYTLTWNLDLNCLVKRMPPKKQLFSMG